MPPTLYLFHSLDGGWMLTDRRDGSRLPIDDELGYKPGDWKYIADVPSVLSRQMAGGIMAYHLATSSSTTHSGKILGGSHHAEPRFQGEPTRRHVAEDAVACHKLVDLLKLTQAGDGRRAQSSRSCRTRWSSRCTTNSYPRRVSG
jgi:hypothetical protein